MGFTATPHILEAPRGFFRAAGGGYDEAAIRGMLGKPWTFADPGVSIKPHPSGSLTHPGMTLMLSLIRQHDIRPEQVVRVKVGTNQNMPNALIHHRPTTELLAKFSMEFCMAILLLERRGGLNEFTDEVVNRPDVQAMLQKVVFGVHPEAEAAGYDKMTTIIEIELADGRRIGGRADFGKGSPANPMSYDEVAEKFRECARYSRWPRQKAEQVVALVRGLESLRDVRELTDLLEDRADRPRPEGCREGGTAEAIPIGGRAESERLTSPKEVQMKARVRMVAVALVALVLGLGLVPAAGAAGFPDKPITLIVHAGAGGGSDIFSRTLSRPLTRRSCCRSRSSSRTSRAGAAPSRSRTWGPRRATPISSLRR
jgi:hypothetical protein